MDDDFLDESLDLADALIHISIAFYHSCRCAAGKLAFLGNTLETFRFAFNAVLQLTSFGRQQPNDFIWSTGRWRPQPGRREINGLADLEFVTCHACPTFVAEWTACSMTRPVRLKEFALVHALPRPPDAPAHERPDRELTDPPFGLLRRWPRREDLWRLARAGLL